MRNDYKKIETEVAHLKEAIKESNLNYFLSESPFSISIKLRKSFISRYSENTNPTSSTPVKSKSQNDTFNQENDSGLCSQETDLNQQIADLQKQIVNSVLENNEEVKVLKDEIQNKNTAIVELKEQVEKYKEENVTLKSELKIRNEQMKIKNKKIDNANVQIESFQKANESFKTNLNNKITNLEHKNKKLITDLEQKKSELRTEKNNTKKLISDLEKSKIKLKKNFANIQTQTEEIKHPKTESVVTQTVSKETVDKSTSSLFSKIYLEGNPTHDISCLCICHGDIEKCELQLFKHTSDTDEAVESIYYRDDFNYDDLPDYEIESSNEEALNRLSRLKSMIDDEDLMREMLGDALKTILDEKQLNDLTNDNNDELNLSQEMEIL